MLPEAVCGARTDRGGAVCAASAKKKGGARFGKERAVACLKLEQGLALLEPYSISHNTDEPLAGAQEEAT